MKKQVVLFLLTLIFALSSVAAYAAPVTKKAKIVPIPVSKKKPVVSHPVLKPNMKVLNQVVHIQSESVTIKDIPVITRVIPMVPVEFPPFELGPLNPSPDNAYIIRDDLFISKPRPMM